MSFRYDINGLRAIAVIAVVLFHFNPAWVAGGFAGVDVFFVISGFLMTGIIFKGLENDSFNLFAFYVARANRIIPALVVLCLVLLIFGWFYLTPFDYKALGEHVASSSGFISNVIFWRETGYFDAAAHEKWLLHTWSLSVEWQFYIIYPIALVIFKQFLSFENLKRLIILGIVLGFLFSVAATIEWPDAAYFLLSTRAWEMMMGGAAFLYPWSLSEKGKKLTEAVGIAFVLISYGYVSSDVPWPGHFALLPVLGAYLIIVSNRQSSLLTNNVLFQCIGKWSYSIYLWHWPVVVMGYYFEFGNWWVIGIPLSLFLGFLSYALIENVRFKKYSNWLSIVKVAPMYMIILTSLLSVSIYSLDGVKSRVPPELLEVFSLAVESPYRHKCHVSDYQSPENSCEYFSKNVKWAVFGDSHTVEIAYALAEKLQEIDEGVKHFSFSGCRPSYGFKNEHSKCSHWYNESVDYIVNRDDIEYVVFNHRYSSALLGDHASIYPLVGDLASDAPELLESIDHTIREFAKVKSKVYVFYPIPELRKSITSLLANAWVSGGEYENVHGATRKFYEDRNEIIINFFKSKSYPENVIFIEPAKYYCNDTACFASLNGVPLYFDDDHPSVTGARLLVNPIFENGSSLH